MKKTIRRQSARGHRMLTDGKTAKSQFKHIDHSKFIISPSLKKLFSYIGLPPKSEFIPDDFQKEALKRLSDSDVLVSAPTGAGKTWIAMQAISDGLKSGKKIWYASPLKALSNSIYEILKVDFGTEYCGILTGDRKENADAPVIVGTTEILRNQLYDAMHQGTSITSDLVIVDEAHYISEPDRGVVWEEVFIYLPSRVRLLMLSATISNAEDLAGWLEKLRNVPTTVVKSEVRPVPLEMLFFIPEGKIVHLGGKNGISSEVKSYLNTQNKDHKKNYGEKHTGGFPFPVLMDILQTKNLLPAIIFLKSRNECDRAVESFMSFKKKKYTNEALFFDKINELIEHNHVIADYRHMKPLKNFRVASHHAGQLPQWKLFVEELMSKGYLDAIFSTSTVAAGVNFPARTVVLTQSDRFNGTEFLPLSVSEFHQMVGRAGRRGKDNIGFGLVLPGPYQDPVFINKISHSKPEPVSSKIKINFSMCLNLLLSHTPEDINKLLENSFGSWQAGSPPPYIMKSLTNITAELRKILPKAACKFSNPFTVSDFIDQRNKIKQDMRYTHSLLRRYGKMNLLLEYITPGRVFRGTDGELLVVIKRIRIKNRDGCLAADIFGNTRQIQLRKITVLTDCIIPFSGRSEESYFSKKLINIMPNSFNDIPVKNLSSVSLEKTKEKYDRENANLICSSCLHLKECSKNKKGTIRDLLSNLDDIAFNLRNTSLGLSISFSKHIKLLQETGFVDSHYKLSYDGIWASRLRVDFPIIIAEAIRNSAFNILEPELLAAGISIFAWDRDQDIQFLSKKTIFDLSIPFSVVKKILSSVESLLELMDRQGFNPPVLLRWPAGAIYLWAKGVNWDKLIEAVGIDDGDMASLIMRTVDHLRQLLDLSETHHDMALSAEKAINMIMREPVFITD